jgi:hypothetical protein
VYLYTDQTYSNKIIAFWEHEGLVYNKEFSEEEVKLLCNLGLTKNKPTNLLVDTVKQKNEKTLTRGETDNNEELLKKISEMCSDFNQKSYSEKHSYARSLARRLYDQGYEKVVINAHGNILLSNDTREKYALTISTAKIVKETVFKKSEYGKIIYGILKEDYKSFFEELNKKWRGEKFYLNPHVRKVFESNNLINAYDKIESFKITYQKLKIESLPTHRQKILAVVLARIEELKNEVEKAKKSIFPDVFFGVEAKNYKIAQLKLIKKDMMNNQLDDFLIRNRIEAELFNTKLASGRTYQTLVTINNIYDQSDQNEWTQQWKHWK